MLNIHLPPGKRGPSFPPEGDALVRRQYKTTKARQNAPGMGCEFALPFVFSPYFADSYGGKETTHKSLLKDVCYKLINFLYLHCVNIRNTLRKM